MATTSLNLKSKGASMRTWYDSEPIGRLVLKLLAYSQLLKPQK
jgi:hypothetical protein